MLPFTLYVVGLLVAVVGFGYALSLLHMPETSIAVGILVIVGAGLISAGTHIESYLFPKTFRIPY